MSDWADEECGNAALGDVRRTRRLTRLMRALAEQPERCVPSACDDWWETKAAYRFWAYDDLTPEQILSSHVQRTLERAAQEAWVLAVQDTSQLRYTTHRATADLGRLRRPGQRGMFVHPVLIVARDGVPLGLLSLDFWTWPDTSATDTRWQRSQKPTSEKVTRCWLKGLEAACRIPTSTRVVVVADREADLFALLAQPRPAHVDLLIRCRERRRRVEHPLRYAGTALQQSPVLGQTTVQVSRRDGRPARTACVQIQALSLITHPPANTPRDTGWAPLPLQWLWVREPNPPRGQKALGWLPVTTLPIENLEQAVQILQAYALRWRIERWFYVLKQGCRVEKLALETAARLQRAVATYAVVAWRVLWLTLAAQQRPNTSCEAALRSAEWQALDCYVHRTAQPRGSPPTVLEAVRWLGQMDGRTHAAHRKLPGVTAIWQALQRLHDLTAMYERLTHPPPKIVGNA